MGDHCTGASRVLVAILTVVGLVASACGNDAVTTESSPTTIEAGETSTTASSSGESSSTSTTAAPLTASHRGVTADTIHVGVSLLNMDQMRDDGLSPAGFGDQALVWNTLFDDLNQRGGINGRRVEAELDFYNPINTVGAEALCVRFAEDLELFAVLGGFLGPAQPATTCLAENEELMLIGGAMTNELLSTATAAWFTDGRRRSRTIPSFLDLLDADGRLEGRSVAVVSGDENQLDTAEILLPELADRGVEVVLEAVNDVVGTDVPAEDAIWAAIAEQIRVQGAEVVLVNGDTTSAIRGITRAGLDVEIWVVEAGQLASLGESVDRADADGAITIQGLTADESWEEPLNVACRQIFLDANPDIEVKSPSEIAVDEEQWLTSIGQACRNISLFEILATEAGDDLAPESVIAAADGLGEFAIPGIPNASLGPGKPDVNDSARLTVWDSTAGENGQLVALTDIIDLTP